MSTLTTPQPTSTDFGHDLNHWYCCDPDLALCGADLSDVLEGFDDVPICAVCSDLMELPQCSANCNAQDTP